MWNKFAKTSSMNQGTGDPDKFQTKTNRQNNCVIGLFHRKVYWNLDKNETNLMIQCNVLQWKWNNAKHNCIGWLNIVLMSIVSPMKLSEQTTIECRDGYDSFIFYQLLSTVMEKRRKQKIKWNKLQLKCLALAFFVRWEIWLRKIPDERRFIDKN